MRLGAVLRTRPAPFINTRPLTSVIKSFSTMSDQLTNTDSPPAKRSRTDAGPSTLPDPVMPVAATKAMFAPQRTKAEEKRRKRKEKHPLPTPYSNEDILWHDVRDFLGPEYVDGLIAEDADAAWKAPEGLEHGKEFTIRAGAFTVSGMFAELTGANERRLDITVHRPQGQAMGGDHSVCAPGRSDSVQDIQTPPYAFKRGHGGDLGI